MARQYSDEQLLDATQRVLTRVLERQFWHEGLPISQLHDILAWRVDADLIRESANPPELQEALVNLPELEWVALVGELDFRAMFPNAKL